jgi:hypothetical protein
MAKLDIVLSANNMAGAELASIANSLERSVLATGVLGRPGFGGEDPNDGGWGIGTPIGTRIDWAAMTAKAYGFLKEILTPAWLLKTILGKTFIGPTIESVEQIGQQIIQGDYSGIPDMRGLVSGPGSAFSELFGPPNNPNSLAFPFSNPAVIDRVPNSYSVAQEEFLQRRLTERRENPFSLAQENWLASLNPPPTFDPLATSSSAEEGLALAASLGLISEADYGITNATQNYLDFLTATGVETEEVKLRTEEYRQVLINLADHADRMGGEIRYDIAFSVSGWPTVNDPDFIDFGGGGDSIFGVGSTGFSGIPVPPEGGQISPSTSNPFQKLSEEEIFAFKNIPELAAGGSASAGNPYIVGERGYELFVPSQSGRIVPHNETKQMLSGGGGTINIYAPLTIRAAEGASLQQILEELA